MVSTEHLDKLRVTLNGVWNAQNTIQTVYDLQVESESVLSESNLIADMGAIFGGLAEIIAGLSTALMVYNGLYLTNVTKNSPFGFIVLPDAVPGTVTGVADSPPGVAALVLFRTYVNRMVLRKYFGPVSEGLTNSDCLLTSGALDILNAAGAFLVADLDGGFGTYSYGHYNTNTGLWVRPHSAQAQAIPAYQRRRRQGHGS